MPDVQRSSTGSRVALTLNNTNMGFVKHAEGGNAYSEVVNEPVGPSRFPKKHLAGLKYEDLSLQIGLSMDSMVYDWIAASWMGGHVRKDGTLTTYDNRFKVLGEQHFFQTMITETVVPALDTSSKAPGYLTLALSPERTTIAVGSGGPPPVAKPEKAWQVCNFRLEIPGLDCAQVSQIDSFSVKLPFTNSEIGNQRDYQKEPGNIEFPNLAFTLPVTHMQTWQDWFETFVIRGNNGNDSEKMGMLHFLAPDLKTELASIQFSGLGIFKLAPDKVEARNEQIRHLKAELYCEEMKFVCPKPAAP